MRHHSVIFAVIILLVAYVTVLQEAESCGGGGGGGGMKGGKGMKGFKGMKGKGGKGGGGFKGKAKAVKMVKAYKSVKSVHSPYYHDDEPEVQYIYKKPKVKRVVQYVPVVEQRPRAVEHRYVAAPNHYQPEYQQNHYARPSSAAQNHHHHYGDMGDDDYELHHRPARRPVPSQQHYLEQPMETVTVERPSMRRQLGHALAKALVHKLES